MPFQFQHLPNAKELICYCCEGWLSVSPVYSIQSVGFICGRCKDFADSVPLNIDTIALSRQVAYETVAEHFLFPCINKVRGCSVLLKWNEALQHEQTCTFKKLPCPLNAAKEDTCFWNGSITEFYSHVEKVHPKNLLNPPQFQLDLTSEETKMLFTTVAGQHFAIYYQLNKAANKLYGLVLLISKPAENSSYRYQFELWDENSINSVILRKSKVDYVNDISEAIKDADLLLQIDIAAVNSMLGNLKSILCKIGIVPNAVKKQNKSTVNISAASTKQQIPSTSDVTKKLKQGLQLSQSSAEFLEDLECPICKEYMVPPIFICGTGHSICSKCRPQLLNCPTCQSVLQNVRNFALEKLTAHVTYPCKNQDKGCAFFGLYDTIRNHESQCTFGDSVSCLLYCKWQGSTIGMANHLRDKHSDEVIKTDVTLRRDIKAAITTTYHIFCASNSVFRLACKHSTTTGPVKFNVQQWGVPKPTFKYTLSFVDQTKFGLDLIVSQVCDKFSKLPTDALKTGVSIPYDMLQPFVDKKKFLFFNVKISKL